MAGESATKWRIRPPDEIAWRELADEVIILDLRTSMYWALNGAAALLWIARAEGGTLEELAEPLQEQFGVKPNLALYDTSNFLASSREQDLVQKT